MIDIRFVFVLFNIITLIAATSITKVSLKVHEFPSTYWYLSVVFWGLSAGLVLVNIRNIAYAINLSKS